MITFWTIFYFSGLSCYFCKYLADSKYREEFDRSANFIADQQEDKIPDWVRNNVVFAAMIFWPMMAWEDLGDKDN